jgi:hypothetical protein
VLAVAPAHSSGCLEAQAPAVADDSAHNGEEWSKSLDDQSGADADAALALLHAHTAAMMSKRRRRRRSRTPESLSYGFTTSTGGLSTASNTTMTATVDLPPSDTAPTVCPTSAAEAELLLFASGSHLTPAALLSHPLLWHCCSSLFLNAEHAPFDAVLGALLSGLRELSRSSDSLPPGPARAVRDAAGAAELLSAAKKELCSELVTLSEVCMGVYNPPHKYAAAADTAMQPLISELLNAQQRIVGTSAIIYVGALARAFPAPMYFEDCISVLVDLGRLRPTSRWDPMPLDDTQDGSCGAGCFPEWVQPPASGEACSRGLRAASSFRSFEQLGIIPQSGTPKTPFYSPHASFTSEQEAWMTAASVPTNEGGVRTRAVAHLLSWYGGWHEARRDGLDFGGVLTVSQDPSKERDVLPMEPLGRSDDISCIVSEVEGGSGLIVVSGVRGV